MMIAARLAGGNLFFCLFEVGDFESTRSSSERLGFFLRGFFGGGILFWGGVVGGVLDCKCWKKLKND